MYPEWNNQRTQLIIKRTKGDYFEVHQLYNGYWRVEPYHETFSQPRDAVVYACNKLSTHTLDLFRVVRRDENMMHETLCLVHHGGVFVKPPGWSFDAFGPFQKIVDQPGLLR